MDDNLENKSVNREKMILFLKKNKIKFIYFFIIFLIIISLIIFLKVNNTKKNELISEKYIEAGLLMVSNELEQSRKLYEEIIFSKNKFYSMLALQTLLEKDIVKDNNKILEYFEIVEKINKSKKQKDLFDFKKALFLIKISKLDEGNKLLQNLIDSNSELENIAKDLIEQ